MIRILRLSALVVWAMLSVVAVGATAFYAVLSVVAVFVYGHAPWNFPGDPPTFDSLIIPAVVASGLSLSLCLLFRRHARTTRRAQMLYSASWFATTVSVVILVACAAGILERQDARWSKIRNGVREYGDDIAAAVGDRHRTLTREEFERFHLQLMPTPVPVDLPGYGVVHLRMSHSVYPYVGVDFRDGGHAVFDPRTMWCTYSD